MINYDYSKRYDDRHRYLRQRSLLRVRLFGGWCLCPLCWMPTHHRKHQRIRGVERQRRKWMESHHLAYSPVLVIPCCKPCHEHLHHPKRWRRDKQNPDRNRNILRIIVASTVLYWLAIAISACVRLPLRAIGIR